LRKALKSSFSVEGKKEKGRGKGGDKKSTPPFAGVRVDEALAFRPSSFLSFASIEKKNSGKRKGKREKNGFAVCYHSKPSYLTFLEEEKRGKGERRE